MTDTHKKLRDDLKVGDTVESNGGWRGEIVAINESANKWPYTVMKPEGPEELFAGFELTKVEIEKPVRGEVIDSLKLVNAEIQATEQKLKGLKLTRKVLEGFSAQLG